MSSDELLKEALLLAFLQRFRLQKSRFVASPGTAKADGKASLNMNDNSWRAVGKEIMALHESYTGGGGQFSHEQNPLHRHQAGYQFYFLPRNLFRVRQVLENLPWQNGAGLAQLAAGFEDQSNRKSLNVLDLGCGTGAFSLALLSHVGNTGVKGTFAVNIVLVDQGRSLLEMAQANIRAFASRALPHVPLSLEPRPEGVEAYLAAEKRRGVFGVVGAGMMLNEMSLLASRRGGKRAMRFIKPLMHLPMPGGLVLFVEPGTRKGYMNLMTIRDQLDGHPILFPCPHNKPCPLWSPKVNRWCHSTRPIPQDWLFDEELRRSARLKFAMREINLAGLAFQTGAKGRVLPPFYKPLGARVVSGRLPQKRGKPGKVTEKPGSASGAVVLSCGDQGTIKEIPAESLGEYPRGLWLAQAGRRTSKRG